jgi:hypothetical protein
MYIFMHNQGMIYGYALIIELGRPRALMRRHLLCLFQISAIGQVNRDASGATSCAAE